MKKGWSIIQAFTVYIYFLIHFCSNFFNPLHDRRASFKKGVGWCNGSAKLHQSHQQRNKQQHQRPQTKARNLQEEHRQKGGGMLQQQQSLNFSSVYFRGYLFTFVNFYFLLVEIGLGDFVSPGRPRHPSRADSPYFSVRSRKTSVLF